MTEIFPLEVKADVIVIFIDGRTVTIKVTKLQCLILKRIMNIFKMGIFV